MISSAILSDGKAERVVAGMATMPSRSRTARFAIRSVVRQVDALYLYLDGFEEVPAFALHPKVIPILSEEGARLKANGKLLGLALDAAATHYLTVDDDYWYPRNFVRRLRSALDWSLDAAVVGVHGSTFTRPFRSYVESRRVITSWKHLRKPQEVDVVATCGTMHRTSDLRFDVRDWNVVNQVDLHFAREVRRAKMRALVVAKPFLWMLPLSSNQSDSIFHRLQKCDQSQSEFARTIFDL